MKTVMRLSDFFEVYASWSRATGAYRRTVFYRNPPPSASNCELIPFFNIPTKENPMITIEDQISLAPEVALDVIKVGDGFIHNGALYVLLDRLTGMKSALVLKYNKPANKLESTTLSLAVSVNPVRTELHIRFSSYKE